MEAAALARASLVRIYPDAREDSLVAAYALLIVAPVSLLASRWLVRRGARTTPLQVVSLSFLVPALLVGVPAVRVCAQGVPMAVSRLMRMTVRH
ncbi:hypothetical protein PINS_up022753 [Pythium insidiosum]|nr:hypothetical protein PINS_up022753 [Pythium insidiosum]